MNLIGNKEEFGIEYNFIDETHETELSIFVKGRDLLLWKNGAEEWRKAKDNFDKIVNWLKVFITKNFVEDPYPIDADGEFASLKNINGHNLDPKYDKDYKDVYKIIKEWRKRHFWLTPYTDNTISGLYFCVIGDYVEISWDNERQFADEDYRYIIGGDYVDKNLFYNIVKEFITIYEKHWTKKEDM